MHDSAILVHRMYHLAVVAVVGLQVVGYFS